MKENWDDLRYFLAVHRQRLPARAALELGVSYMTVLRRLETLETRLGVPLFNRSSQGYELTHDGRELLKVAERMEMSMRGINVRLGQCEGEVSGLVRVACGEGLGLSLIARYLPEFTETYPDIQIELNVTQFPSDIEERGSHVYFRPIQELSTTAPRLIRHELSPIDFAFFASTDYVGRMGKPASVEDLASHKVVNVSDIGFYVNALEWVDRKVPPESVIMRSYSYAAVIRACQMGVGAAVLPRFVGLETAGLEHLFALPDSMRTTLWALALPDVAEIPRVRTLLTFLTTRTRQDLNLFAPSLAEQG